MFRLNGLPALLALIATVGPCHPAAKPGPQPVPRDTGGSVCPFGDTDGCRGAPIDGSFQFATYFAEAGQTRRGPYRDAKGVPSAHPPQFNVAGVDGKLGYNSSLPRKVPGVDASRWSGPGWSCTFNAAGSRDYRHFNGDSNVAAVGPKITCTGSSPTFGEEGAWWDLTGVQVRFENITPGSTITLKNVKHWADSSFDRNSGALVMVSVEPGTDASVVFDRIDADTDPAIFASTAHGLMDNGIVYCRCNVLGPNDNLTVKYVAFRHWLGRPIAWTGLGTLDVGHVFQGPSIYAGHANDAINEGHGELVLDLFTPVASITQTGRMLTVRASHGTPQFSLKVGTVVDLSDGVTETVTGGPACAGAACEGATFTMSVSHDVASARAEQGASPGARHYHDITFWQSSAVSGGGTTGGLYLSSGMNEAISTTVADLEVDHIVSITNQATVPYCPKASNPGQPGNCDTKRVTTPNGAAVGFFQANTFTNPPRLHDIWIDPSGAGNCFTEHASAAFPRGRPIYSRVYNLTTGHEIKSGARTCENVGPT